jgi:hypothetical protein
VPDNVRRGRPQGKRHRNQTAARPSADVVRVKRCGKSAPRAWQHERHGKPHREQDRIGATEALLLSRRTASVSGSSPGLVARGGRQRPSQRNGRHVRGSPARHTEPGLQAGWHPTPARRPVVLALRVRFSRAVPRHGRASYRPCRFPIRDRSVSSRRHGRPCRLRSEAARTPACSDRRRRGTPGRGDSGA